MAILINLLSVIFTNPLVERLALVSLELLALSALVWLVIRVLRIRSARVCALLWLIVLVKAVFGFVAGPLWTPMQVAVPGAALALTPASLAAQRQWPMEYALASEPSLQRPEARPGATAKADLADPRAIQPESMAEMLMQTRRYVIVTASMVGVVLVGVWLLGALAMLALTVRDLLTIRRLYADSEAPSATMAAAFAGEIARLRILAPPCLRVSEALVTPALVGWFRPAVLLPAWVAEEFPADRLRWLLAHELMHWKHLDTLGLLVRRTAQILFWFHPAVWMAGRRWEEAMERACDRAIVSDMNEARDYAEQLYQVLHRMTRRRAAVAFGTGLFVTRTQVGRRIELLLTNPMRMPARLGAASMVMLAALAAGSLSAGVTFIETQPTAQTGQTAAGTPNVMTVTSDHCGNWLKVDFGNPNQPVPPGWIGWSAVYNRSLTNEHNFQAFSLPFEAYLGVEVSRDAMWRTAFKTNYPEPRNALLRDGLRSFGEIRITLRDLDAGDYVFVPVSLNPEDADAPPVTYDVLINGNVVHWHVPSADGNCIDRAFAPTVPFTVADASELGGSQVTIGFRPHDGPLWINGFMLRRVGEPFGDVVTRISAASGRPYALASAATGERPYIDRNYTLVSLPRELDHQILIQPANDDKFSEGEQFLTIDVMRPVTVYLCYGAGEGTLPAWAKDFEPTGKRVVSTDRIYQVYARHYPAGTVVLGGNKEGDVGSISQYLVVVKPDPQDHDS